MVRGRGVLEAVATLGGLVIVKDRHPSASFSLVGAGQPVEVL